MNDYFMFLSTRHLSSPSSSWSPGTAVTPPSEGVLRKHQPEKKKVVFKPSAIKGVLVSCISVRYASHSAAGRESSSDCHQHRTENRPSSALPGRHRQLPLPLPTPFFEGLSTSWTPPVWPAALWQAIQEHQSTDLRTQRQFLSPGLRPIYVYFALFLCVVQD